MSYTKQTNNNGYNYELFEDWPNIIIIIITGIASLPIEYKYLKIRFMNINYYRPDFFLYVLKHIF